jgi:hypothetical protein
MRRTSYMKRAANRFLAGTRIKTPFEAVEAGICRLEDWARLLSEEREIEQQYLLSRQRRRGKPRRNMQVATSETVRMDVGGLEQPVHLPEAALVMMAGPGIER